MAVSVAEITEITTGLGMLADAPASAFRRRPMQLLNVGDSTWAELEAAYASGDRRALFDDAFANGRFFLSAPDGLRSRVPTTVEWKGPHRVPGDDAIPADLRVDRVYLISCKYLSRVVLNSGPSRLFDRALRGDERSNVDWFLEVAPIAYQGFYDTVRETLALPDLPGRVSEITRGEREMLREALRARVLPTGCRDAWSELCGEVAARSAARWRSCMPTRRAELELFWRMVRIVGSTYFVVGVDGTSSLRLRVGAKWDWLQDHEFLGLDVTPRVAGQPEIGWAARVRDRATGEVVAVEGHVEVRWSHGRFRGFPEAKVYLDTPHLHVPGYHALDAPTGSAALTLL